MSATGKILGVMLAGRALADTTPLFSRLLSGIAAVVALAILSSILAGVLLVVLLYAAYSALVAHGLEPQAAMLIMAGLIVVLTGILVMQMLGMINKIKHIPTQVLAKQNPLARKANKIGGAFIDGFMNPPPAQPKN